MGLTINAFGAGTAINAVERSDENGTGKAKQNFYGGALKLASDPVLQRRKEAQEKAFNIVKNAWENDRSVDDAIQARREHYAEMEQLKKETVDSLADINEDKTVLKELYDVADDSQEQKDLELLEKEQDLKNGVIHEGLTGEEKRRLEEIHKEPLTEYQTRALELNDQAGNLKLQIEDVDRRMRDDTADIYRIKQERLKSNPMLEAQKAAEELNQAANDEIIGMLIEEAKEHIDEKMEEAEEKAGESMEKKEEREEKLEELKLKRAVQEALIEGTKEAVEEAKAAERRSEAPDIELNDMVDIARGADVSKDVGESLSDIKNSMKLLEADLKGIKVDEEV